jgi:hypothetical protein
LVALRQGRDNEAVGERIHFTNVAPGCLARQL